MDLQIIQSLMTIEVIASLVVIFFALVGILTLKYFSFRTGISVENEVDILEDIKDENVQKIKTNIKNNYLENEAKKAQLANNQKILNPDHKPEPSITNDTQVIKDENEEDKEDDEAH
jgi:hypothetical protein